MMAGVFDDVLDGVSANNILVGGIGSDTFRGGVGDNIIYGESYSTLGGAGTETDTTSRDLIDFSKAGVKSSNRTSIRSQKFLQLLFKFLKLWKVSIIIFFRILASFIFKYVSGTDKEYTFVI